jgi:SAM-dependent methyltransferase
VEPRIGDAFGMVLQAYLDGRPVLELVERDDGYLNGGPADLYFLEPAQWPEADRRMLELLDGSTLDIGAGAGRFALALQERGVPVTALDTSPAAVRVCAARGVRATVCAAVARHARDAAGAYRRFLMAGNNLGLLGSAGQASGFLAALAAMAAPDAVVVAQGTDPYATDDPSHLAYHERNRAHGRMGGQLRIRCRYRNLATDWFDYLLCTPDELAELLRDSAWRLSEVDDSQPPMYVAVLRLR